MKRILAITCAGALVLALASCSNGQGNTSSYAGSSGSSSSVSSSASGSGVSSSGSGVSSSTSESQKAMLYIGMDGQFQEYPLEYDGEITPEVLVQSIAAVTGWNLDLESAVEGNGKIVISFAETSVLYTGLPEEQKEEFKVETAAQLEQTILDSIQKTIQEWVGTEDGAAEVYFTAADGGDLALSGSGVTISADEPYTAFPSTNQ